MPLENEKIQDDAPVLPKKLMGRPTNAPFSQLLAYLNRPHYFARRVGVALNYCVIWNSI